MNFEKEIEQLNKKTAELENKKILNSSIKKAN